MRLLAGVELTSLGIIDTEKGAVLKGLSIDDRVYKGFGEAYFSICNYSSIKAWKTHKKMTSNLLVISGRVLFVIYDPRIDSPTYKIIEEVELSRSNYKMLSIAPGLIYGFQGLDKHCENIICNIADIKHDPNESINIDLKAINYNWR